MSELERVLREAADPVHRQLLEAVFPPFLTDMKDEVTLTGEETPTLLFARLPQ